MSELEPCPFCGSKYAYYSEKTASVRCDDCGASWPEEGATEEERIEAWNARTERTCKMVDSDLTYIDEGLKSCSVCGAYMRVHDNYCPNCGAKVVGE